MALPLGATGSLRPTFVPARGVPLAVRPPCAFALCAGFPYRLRGPSRASVTLWEATAPVKPPTRRGPGPGSGPRLDCQRGQGGISRSAPPGLTPRPLSLPPILHGPAQKSPPSCSEGSRGLSVLLRVDGIFTAAPVSPGGALRQHPDRYAIRAGRNLPDKEFRYLRTVIVTAAVHRGFGSRLRLR